MCTTKKSTKRQVQALQTKRKIYDVLCGLMKEKNFENITIEEICRTSGISVGTFYHYFSSKEDIHQKLFKQMEEALYQDLTNMEPEENVYKAILKFFGYTAQYTMKLELHIHYLNHFNNKIFSNRPSLIYEQLHLIISKGQKEKEITNDMNADEITDYLFIIARGIVLDWCIQNGQYSLESKMHTYMKLIMKSLQMK
ncbi:TetR/AcrR family transcriptional regulator [Brevibacillus brevis]|uniref:TetR/AcrR family transcriptional regulator n=1 Tax=Brevibacillus brevis TaxID=1393 RepID=UPI000D0EC4E7|nr:TetR/AcrR family transcriptional regulator [Brevibacillus brevis]PSJ68791.1 TetR/AcrR family transcriptional regulator [Brevibacillus brevis]RED29340.1 TetR family transcriptional regulator [Brevibacillus brevis]GEC91519.1 hypothetical protein BBR01nite_38500 [Brevibacillus brevis]VEF87941.1 DNA-binding transcriptional repressor AcrR [Brevibacillus brevis]